MSYGGEQKAARLRATLPPLSEKATILIRISPEMMVMLSEGGDMRWEFGEPDADGFYEPTVIATVHLPELT